jgi:hypothetical protein
MSRVFIHIQDFKPPRMCYIIYTSPTTNGVLNLKFHHPGLVAVHASMAAQNSKILDTDVDETMRVAMESSGVKFNGHVAYIRSTGGSLRNLDLAPGDGCWHTVQQYEAQLVYDNHSSIVSLSLSDLDEDSDGIGVRPSDSNHGYFTSENQNEYDDPSNGRVNKAVCSSTSETSITRQDVADENGDFSMQASRRAFQSGKLSHKAASDLAKYVWL